MTFTGTLIEDLIATVERVQQRTQTEEILEVEPWFAASQETAGYESKFLGVA